MKNAAFKVVGGVGALLLAFWVGRVSSPAPESSSGNEKVERGNRSRVSSGGGSASSPVSPPAGIVTPGAGVKSVRSAEQLRRIFNTRGTMAAGEVQMALSRMNSQEFQALAKDLVAQQKANPGYSWYQEIQQVYARWAEVNPAAALEFAKANNGKDSTYGLTAIISTLALKDPAYALQEAKKIKNLQQSRSLISSALLAMVKKNPDLWMHTINSDSKLAQLAGMWQVASEWAKDDPEGAVERLKKLPANLRQQGIPQIASVWAGQDSEAALAWARSIPNASNRSQAINSIMQVISRKDPDEAFAILDTFPAGLRRTGLHQIFSNLSRSDFDGAVQRALALPTVDQFGALNGILGGGSHHGSNWGARYGRYYSGNHPQLSLEQLQNLLPQLPKGALREQAMGQITYHLQYLPEEQFEAAVGSYSAAERKKIITSMAFNLSSSDPERALALYQELPEGSVQNQQYTQIISQLARKDPERALELANKGKTDDEIRKNITSVISIISSQDPASAAKYLSSIEGEKVKGQAISTIGRRWANFDSDAALAWAEQFSGDHKGMALFSVISGMANNDPVRASQTLDKHVSGEQGEKISQAASQIAQSWGNVDPDAAATWVANLPEGSAQNSAIQNMISTWSGRDLEAAGQWIDSFPDGKARDTGVRTIVSNLQHRDAESAFGWANSIGDDRERVSALSSVLSTWKRKDPEKAQAAVEKIDLTEDERKRLMRYFK